MEFGNGLINQKQSAAQKNDLAPIGGPTSQVESGPIKAEEPEKDGEKNQSNDRGDASPQERGTPALLFGKRRGPVRCYTAIR